jgi:hypothetical protein
MYLDITLLTIQSHFPLERDGGGTIVSTASFDFFGCFETKAKHQNSSTNFRNQFPEITPCLEQ